MVDHGWAIHGVTSKGKNSVDYLFMTIASSNKQWRKWVAIFTTGVGIGTGLEQFIDRLQVAPFGSGAQKLGRIHVQGAEQIGNQQVTVQIISLGQINSLGQSQMSIRTIVDQRCDGGAANIVPGSMEQSIFELHTTGYELLQCRYILLAGCPHSGSECAVTGNRVSVGAHELHQQLAGILSGNLKENLILSDSCFIHYARNKRAMVGDSIADYFINLGSGPE